MGVGVELAGTSSYATERGSGVCPYNWSVVRERGHGRWDGTGGYFVLCD